MTTKRIPAALAAAREIDAAYGGAGRTQTVTDIARVIEDHGLRDTEVALADVVAAYDKAAAAGAHVPADLADSIRVFCRPALTKLRKR